MLPLIPLALQFLPQLAQWLIPSNPKASAIAEQVSTVIAAVTGTADPTAVAAALKDPTMAANLQIQLAQIHADQVKAEAEERKSELQMIVDDTKSARDRDVAFLTAGKHNTRSDILAAGTVIGLIVCILVVSILPVGQLAFGIISTVAGIFGSCMKDVFSFEFGSSRQSENKTSIIANMAQNTIPTNLLNSGAISWSDIQKKLS